MRFFAVAFLWASFVVPVSLLASDDPLLAVAKSAVSSKQVKRLLRSRGFAFERVPGSERTYLVSGAEASELEALGLFQSVEADQFIAREEPFVLEQPFLLAPFALPNDPEAQSNWALQKIQAPEAWEIRHSTSDDFIVAIIDSGIDLNHPDLRGNLWVNPGEIPGNRIDDDKNGYVDDVYGADTHLGTGNPQDTVGHGTLCAGIIAGVANNAVGGSGVLWKTKLMMVRAEDGSKRMSYSGVVKGGYYAAAMGAKVINGSWGTFTASPTIKQMLEDIEKQGVILVNAVGNMTNNIDNGHLEYPASYKSPNLITVTASNMKDELVHYADYGQKTVHLAAPGWAVQTTKLGGGYSKEAGTSMSAPFVTAAVALVWSQHSEWDYATVKQKILSSVDRVPALSDKVVTGGRLNLYRALSD